MEIKEHRLLLFIKLYREQFGVELSREDAYRKASLLVRYATLCMRPLAKFDDGATQEPSSERILVESGWLQSSSS